MPAGDPVTHQSNRSGAPVPAADAYHPEVIEPKWEARWAELRTNETDLDGAVKPFFNLMMFPYPSAEGLHVGNMFAFTGADTYGRFKRLRGWNVFEPIGFDAFGIHSENYAIKLGINPAELIPRNIENFRRQLKRMGAMFDWRHELSTTDPGYYKWTQWIFVQLFKAGKAYKKAAPVNWCPSCKTVLANEQVINGACERCGTPVEQRNWLGRSEGAEIDFPLEHGRSIRVFTTRPDTVFGATFMVLAPEHPLVSEITTPAQQEAVDAYRRQVAAKDIISRKIGDREKTGVFTGAFAKNPANGRTIPVWIADYVLMEYGTGAIMAVPGHDERDFEFAKRYGLRIVRVLGRPGQDPEAPMETSETGVDGYRIMNSGEFSGMPAAEGKTAIIRWLEGTSRGKGVIQYRLHDWCISRQRYWGPPIPIIYCDACGPVAVPERDLPVVLPLIEDFRPDDSGVSPLARHEEWYYVDCPQCGARGRRETDVSDTFLDSAWYFLRYPSTEFDDRPFDQVRTRRWLPVASYIGGNEHAVLHLLYSRFIGMVLHELGHTQFDEPFAKFRAHGTIVKDGAKMSKSRGNVVIPDEYIAKWGADTFRTYLMFLGPFHEGGDFRDEGINGPRRFLDRIWQLVADCVRDDATGEIKHRILVKWHQTKKAVTHRLEGLEYNTAISALMELLNVLREENCRERRIVEELVIMVAPFAPHFAEECWERLGHRPSVFNAHWPSWDEHLTVEHTVELVVQVNGKTRSKVHVRRDASETEAVAAALADETVRRFIESKEIRKRILVPNRLVNLVTA